MLSGRRKQQGEGMEATETIWKEETRDKKREEKLCSCKVLSTLHAQWVQGEKEKSCSNVCQFWSQVQAKFEVLLEFPSYTYLLPFQCKQTDVSKSNVFFFSSAICNAKLLCISDHVFWQSSSRNVQQKKVTFAVVTFIVSVNNMRENFPSL